MAHGAFPAHPLKDVIILKALSGLRALTVSYSLELAYLLEYFLNKPGCFGLVQYHRVTTAIALRIEWALVKDYGIHIYGKKCIPQRLKSCCAVCSAGCRPETPELKVPYYTVLQ